MIKEEQLEVYREYLMEQERSENTIYVYLTAIKIFFKRYDELNKKNMLDFKKWQSEKWKPKTVANRVIAMNQYSKFLGHPEYCVKVLKIHQSSSVENVITVEEFRKLLDYLKRVGNEKGYWMLMYLAKTGARISEFIRLPRIALETGYAEMWTKGKIRRIYIPQYLIDESREFFSKSDGEYLFYTKYKTPYTARGVSQNLKSWGKKCGIREEVLSMHIHSGIFMQ